MFDGLHRKMLRSEVSTAGRDEVPMQCYKHG